MTNYSMVEFMNHIDQSLKEAADWHNLDKLPERERKAYQAGFSQGAQAARQLFALHANLKLRIK